MILRLCYRASIPFRSPCSVMNTRFFSIKIAVVGSGPAGFYTTQRLLKNQDIRVDIFEKLPVPFGLVRYGVAPDHQEVKNVINSFTAVANHDRVNFYGNVSLGEAIKVDDLLEAYHAVVLCYGSAQDKLLNIDGELTTKNTISARNFVGWYNGVPEDKDLEIDLNCDTACIIGQGNVALDCARILSKPTNLEKTDITSYAQQMIANSEIKKIYIIGRRGPIQVSFATKELRELMHLNDSRIKIEPSTMFEDYGLSLAQLKSLSRQRRRLVELILNLHAVSKKNLDHSPECILKFMSKPHKIVANRDTGWVERLELQRTRYDNADEFINEKSVPIDTNEFEKIDCGLVIRSIGYKATMVDKSLPFDTKLGAIMNTRGRIHGYRSLYCSGWLATGASGVIAGTLQSSQVTAQSILEDIQNKQLPSLAVDKSGYETIREIVKAKSIQVVHFNDWLQIDLLERRLGETMGKPREKFVDVDKMLDVAREKIKHDQK